MRAGAEKVVLGTVALHNQSLVSSIAAHFGSQAVTVSIDLDSPENRKVISHSGTKTHDIDFKEFVSQIVGLGAGELLIQSKSRDGLMDGLALELISDVSKLVNVPVIASSGVGKLSDFSDGYSSGASAVAAGAFFQFTQFTPQDVRDYLCNKQIPTRVL
jgi:cyclase